MAESVQAYRHDLVIGETPRVNRNISIDERERFAIEFFALNTRSVLTGEGSRRTQLSQWADYTMAISVSEPAVRHAIAALGSAHSSTGNVVHTSLQRPIDEDRSQLAIVFYVASVGRLQALVDRALEEPWLVEAVVVCCTILFILELYRGHDAAAVRHSRSGKRILQQHLHGRLPPPSSTMQHVHTGLTLAGSDPLSRAPHALGAYDCRAARTLGEAADNFQRKHLDVKIAMGERLEALIKDADDLQTQLVRLALARVRRTFPEHSLPIATGYCLARRLSRLVSLGIYPDIKRRLRRTQEAFAAWRIDTATFIQSRPLTTDIIMLLLRFFTSMFNLATCRATDETGMDRFRDDFVRFLGIVEAYFARLRLGWISEDSAAPVVKHPHNVGILDASIISTLLIVASKCRESSLRRKAVDLLRDARRFQGMHSIRSLETLASATVQLEEEMAAICWAIDHPHTVPPALWSAEHVPERARLSDVVISIDDDKGSGSLMCAYSAQSAEGDIRLLEIKNAQNTLGLRQENVYRV